MVLSLFVACVRALVLGQSSCSCAWSVFLFLFVLLVFVIVLVMCSFSLFLIGVTALRYCSLFSARVLVL